MERVEHLSITDLPTVSTKHEGSRACVREREGEIKRGSVGEQGVELVGRKKGTAATPGRKEKQARLAHSHDGAIARSVEYLNLSQLTRQEGDSHRANILLPFAGPRGARCVCIHVV
jgi:hypothetical protein